MLSLETISCPFPGLISMRPFKHIKYSSHSHRAPIIRKIHAFMLRLFSSGLFPEQERKDGFRKFAAVNYFLTQTCRCKISQGLRSQLSGRVMALHTWGLGSIPCTANNNKKRKKKDKKEDRKQKKKNVESGSDDVSTIFCPWQKTRVLLELFGVTFPIPS